MLSICIPTYNNAWALDRTLNSILKQFERSREYSLEICVSDNHSIDNTAAVVAKYQAECGFIKYVRQASNLGPGPNQIRAMEIAQGDFLWLLGDDELSAGSLGHVVSLLAGVGDDVAAVYVGWDSIWDESYRGVRQDLDRSIRMQVTSDMVVRSVDEYLDLRLPTVPFMSAHIYRRALIDWDFARNFEQSCWLQVYILFQVLHRSPVSLHIARACVIDDHSKSEGLEVPKDPWPAGIFSTMFSACMKDLHASGMLSSTQTSTFAASFYRYVYCDRLSLPTFLSQYARALADTQDFGFGSELADALKANNPYWYRSVFWLLAAPATAPTARRLAQVFRRSGSVAT